MAEQPFLCTSIMHSYRLFICLILTSTNKEEYIIKTNDEEQHQKEVIITVLVKLSALFMVLLLQN